MNLFYISAFWSLHIFIFLNFVRYILCNTTSRTKTSSLQQLTSEVGFSQQQLWEFHSQECIFYYCYNTRYISCFFCNYIHTWNDIIFGLIKSKYRFSWRDWSEWQLLDCKLNREEYTESSLKFNKMKSNISNFPLSETEKV